MTQNTQLAQPPAPEQRHKLPTIFAGAILLACVIAYGTYWALAVQYQETTEDAYVEGNMVQVTPQTMGTVIAIHADNTDYVEAGHPLLQLNPADARLALERAEAQLAKTIRQVRGQFTSAAQMQANIEQRRADLSRAKADLDRRTPLVQTGAISKEDYQHAVDAHKTLLAALTAAEQQYATNHALIDHVSIEEHPDVLSAAMQVKEAYIGLSRTELKAPVNGMLTKRNVQVGQRVSPGTPLMSIVPLDHLWVNANFKESQLKDIRIGQSVKLTADVYGHSVDYSGKITGLDAGTGSAFSLIPAQNATGNWIKVVQRVPVRIALDPQQVKVNPLRIGLSMKVVVDTHERQGQALSFLANEVKQTYETNVFELEQKGAEERIKQIIQNNLASKGARSKP